MNEWKFSFNFLSERKQITLQIQNHIEDFSHWNRVKHGYIYHSFNAITALTNKFEPFIWFKMTGMPHECSSRCQG